MACEKSRISPIGSDASEKAFAALKATYDKAGFDVTLDGLDPSGPYYDTIQKPGSDSDLIWGGWGADWPSGSTVLPPLFGLGLPRTGSTALGQLLGEDDRARSLLAWESGAPTPPPDPATYATDPRIAECAAQMALIDEMAPKFKTMLPTSPTGPTECLQIMALDLRSAMFAALGDNRGYEAWFAQCDMVSAMRYHERVLKLLQWRFPTRPWRLKCPAHMA